MKLSSLLHKGFKPDKCNVALKMATARIKLLRNNKQAQVRQMRREVAQLLDGNHDQTARILVEHVIREENFMQAHDFIEVYCKLIVERMSTIDSQKTCPIDLKEAIASVIFASMRCSDVPELEDVRKNFARKYGNAFATSALEVRPDSGVNRLVIEKLSAGAPDVQTKTKTLSSIAAEHNIKWEPKAFEEKLPMGPSYESSEIPGNRNPGGAANSSGSTQDNRRAPDRSVPPSSKHSATTYSSAEIPGSSNSPHENTGSSSIARPYSQHGSTVPGMIPMTDEINRPRERKSSASGSNWNVEFKDTASAAQAAAESAEMASIAARAAVQLASLGNFYAEQNTVPYFDSDGSEEELEPRLTGQTKFSKEQSRTRGVTSDTKRVGRVRTGAQYADETESTPKERENPAEAFSSTEQRRDEPPVPAHIHPKLPADYDSFVAYFKLLAH